jgi:nicotinate phosphoribosyltransferase
MTKENYTMLFDFYEMTMAHGYFNTDYKNKICYFDVFYRSVPDKGGYAICCGLESIIDYISNLKFTESDIEYLRNRKCFSEEFLEYLKDFKFNGDIWCAPEGTIIFPYEPILTVRANTIEAQLIETYLLLALNHQSLIATKTKRIVAAANGRAVMEFGARRAQGESAALLGARSAYIAGAVGTANAMADVKYGVKAIGTMAHSWVQMFDSEYEAFETYCKQYPENATLLVDTFNVLKSGVPNAIKAFKEILWPLGIKKCAIRIDSGDITYLAKKARKMLDEAGLEDCQICVSNSLDEFLIKDLLDQGAPIDTFGVGERLITSKSEPVFGGVYKLTAVESNGVIIPKIKISENEAKITNPGYKKVYRFYCKDTNKALADVICLHDEVIDESMPYVIFDPVQTWKQKELTNFYVKELLTLIFKDGQLVYNKPTLEEIRANCQKEYDSLWDETKRFSNPNKYYVDLSQKLWDLKNDMLTEYFYNNNKK